MTNSLPGSSHPSTVARRWSTFSNHPDRIEMHIPGYLRRTFPPLDDQRLETSSLKYPHLAVHTAAAPSAPMRLMGINRTSSGII